MTDARADALAADGDVEGATEAQLAADLAESDWPPSDADIDRIAENAGAIAGAAACAAVGAGLASPLCAAAGAWIAGVVVDAIRTAFGGRKRAPDDYSLVDAIAEAAGMTATDGRALFWEIHRTAAVQEGCTKWAMKHVRSAEFRRIHAAAIYSRASEYANYRRKAGGDPVPVTPADTERALNMYAMSWQSYCVMQVYAARAMALAAEREAQRLLEPGLLLLMEMRRVLGAKSRLWPDTPPKVPIKIPILR
jgi:hypothetical protein